MKINQIIVENKKVDEAPVGAFKQMGRKLGSRALNKVGAKSMAANMAGKADLGATANKLHQQFSGYMGTQNKDISQATGQDLKAFLATKNVSVNVPNGKIDPTRMDKMLLKVARDAMTKKSTPAAQRQRQQKGSANTPPAAQGQQQGKTSSAYSQTVQAAKKLSAKEKRRLITQLQKTLPAAAGSNPSFNSRRTPPTP